MLPPDALFIQNLPCTSGPLLVYPTLGAIVTEGGVKQTVAVAAFAALDPMLDYIQAEFPSSYPHFVRLRRPR